LCWLLLTIGVPTPDDGISIPSSYTSFVAPLSAHKIWADVKQFGDLKHFETAFVVRVFNCMELADPLPVFTFVHPNRDQGTRRSPARSLSLARLLADNRCLEQ